MGVHQVNLELETECGRVVAGAPIQILDGTLRLFDQSELVVEKTLFGLGTDVYVKAEFTTKENSIAIDSVEIKDLVAVQSRDEIVDKNVDYDGSDDVDYHATRITTPGIDGVIIEAQDPATENFVKEITVSHKDADDCTGNDGYTTLQDGAKLKKFNALATKEDVVKISFGTSIDSKCIRINVQQKEGTGGAKMSFFKRTEQAPIQIFDSTDLVYAQVSNTSPTHVIKYNLKSTHFWHDDVGVHTQIRGTYEIGFVDGNRRNLKQIEILEYMLDDVKHSRRQMIETEFVESELGADIEIRTPFDKEDDISNPFVEPVKIDEDKYIQKINFEGKIESIKDKQTFLQDCTRLLNIENVQCVDIQLADMTITFESTSANKLESAMKNIEEGEGLILMNENGEEARFRMIKYEITTQVPESEIPETEDGVAKSEEKWSENIVDNGFALGLVILALIFLMLASFYYFNRQNQEKTWDMEHDNKNKIDAGEGNDMDDDETSVMDMSEEPSSILSEFNEKRLQNLRFARYDNDESDYSDLTSRIGVEFEAVTVIPHNIKSHHDFRHIK